MMFPAMTTTRQWSSTFSVGSFVSGSVPVESVCSLGDLRGADLSGAILDATILTGAQADKSTLGLDAEKRRQLGIIEAGHDRSAQILNHSLLDPDLRIWQKASPLTLDEWERVRLHAYHSERVLCHSPFLAALAPVATNHHERLDGSGYQVHELPPARGVTLSNWVRWPDIIGQQAPASSGLWHKAAG